MRIGIVGTRGIPNNYGGFEQFAEFLSRQLILDGHSITVYNSHDHVFGESEWNGVSIIHKYDPEYLVGTFGQFIYDFNCIIDSRRRSFDIILQLGYTSSTIWSFLFPRKSILITNMDGLEYKRSKYNPLVQRFLKYAEYLGARWSDYLVADSPAIKDYLLSEYGKDSTFIPYGAFVFSDPDVESLKTYNVAAGEYNMLIARMEPENNIEVILDGAVLAGDKRPLLVVGNVGKSFGQHLVSKFGSHNNIRFMGPIYNVTALNNLRYFSNLYFHGHSVGGTNPSLLEAMASNALICAHDNGFNRAVLGDDAHYFANSRDVADSLARVTKSATEESKLTRNREKVDKLYNWPKVIKQYEELFVSTLAGRTA